MTVRVWSRLHGGFVGSWSGTSGRTMMLYHLRAMIATAAATSSPVFSRDPEGIGEPLATLREFRLELGLPVWTFEYQGNVIETRIVMPHRQNTVFITLERISGSGKVRFSFDPWIQFRPHEGVLSGLADNQY